MQEWMLLKRTSYGMKCVIIIMHDGSINIHKNHHYHRQRWQRRNKHLKLMQRVKMRRRMTKICGKIFFIRAKLSIWAGGIEDSSLGWTRWRQTSMNESTYVDIATESVIKLWEISIILFFRVISSTFEFLTTYACKQLHAKLHSKIFA
mgnify:CR=1 FL=1